MRIRVERLELIVVDTGGDPRQLAADVGASLHAELGLRRDQLDMGVRANLAVQVPPASTAGQIAAAVADHLTASPEELS